MTEPTETIPKQIAPNAPKKKFTAADKMKEVSTPPAIQ